MISMLIHRVALYQSKVPSQCSQCYHHVSRLHTDLQHPQPTQCGTYHLFKFVSHGPVSMLEIWSPWNASFSLDELFLFNKIEYNGEPTGRGERNNIEKIERISGSSSFLNQIFHKEPLGITTVIVIPPKGKMNV